MIACHSCNFATLVISRRSLAEIHAVTESQTSSATPERAIGALPDLSLFGIFARTLLICITPSILIRSSSQEV